MFTKPLGAINKYHISALRLGNLYIFKMLANVVVCVIYILTYSNTKLINPLISLILVCADKSIESIFIEL